MSRHKKSATVLLAMGILALCLSLLAVETQTKVLRRLIDDAIYDNRNHYFSCEQLPQLSQVESIVDEHQDLILRIEQVNPGFVGIEIDTTTCSGKGDILFWYGSHRDRLAIETLIGETTFLGVPYRLQNR